ncbi:ABC-three component system middle component 1 [Bacillus weihaiensis]|uniref:ABC-three component system middle component 1 n=1 Tax=Bacillus weihaiensis TaxID=1547283 RepID=UPI002353F7EB|nr:ABC-three component system middle component 1 [Bacillus weihaiensis]
MFRNNPDIIEKIKKESGNNFMDSVECRIKTEGRYNIHIFTVVLKDQNELLENWIDISSDIAIHFQNELKSEVEIWNIYILFLVLGSVDSGTQYIVEQNKYSSRKIVVQGVSRPLDGQEIEKIIMDKLFNIQVDTAKNRNIPTEPVSKTIETKFATLYKAINSDDDEKSSDLYTKYLELLKNGF